VVAAGAKAAAR